jgi:putative ABC transport system permease protein
MHQERGATFFGILGQDVRFALRMFHRNRAFTTLAVLTIALGIGPNTAIFSTIYGLLWGPREATKFDRTVILWSKHGSEQGYGDRGNIHVSPRDYLEWKRQTSSFAGMGAVTQRDMNLDDQAQNPQRITIQSYTPGLMTVTGMPIMMGRDFVAEEGAPGKDHEVILGHKLWQQRYNSDPHILGKQIRLDDGPYTIVGVRPPGETDRRLEQLWTCLVVDPTLPDQDERYLTVLAVLKPGVTADQAQAEMNTISRRLALLFPKSDAGWTVDVKSSASSWIDQRTLTNLLLLMGTVVLVLLIACVNVSNLLLARGASRQNEVAARLALGASRSQIFRQFLTESLMLSVMGGLLGTGLGWIIIKVFLALLPPYALNPNAQVGLNLPVLLFTVGATLLAGIVFGCAPAWSTARLDLNEALKSGGRAGMRRGRHGLGRALVVLELTIALTLLATAELVLQRLWSQTHTDFGVRIDHILTFQLPLSRGRFPNPRQATEYNHLLLDKMRAIPGVESVAAVYGVPLTAMSPAHLPFTITGMPARETSPPPVILRMVSPGFFQTFGVQLRHGRYLTEEDRVGTLPVVMVNEKFVRNYLSGVDPLVREIVVGGGERGPDPPLKVRIVGVFRDIDNAEEFGSVTTPEMVLPMTQYPQPFTTLAIRTSGDPESMVKSITAAVHTIDSSLPLTKVETMDQIIRERLGFNRFEAWVYGTFAGLALVLCAVGIYGLMTFVVSQRTPELGIRMALGASRGSILAMVLSEGARLALVGLVFGFAGAFFGDRIMQTSLYGSGSMSLLAIVLVGMGLLGVVLLACVIPAHRAARVDPMVALRSE